MEIIRQLRCWLKSPTQLSSVPTVSELVERSLEKLLPRNAHELCTDRLGLSVTKVWPLENKFISKFRTRRDLIDAICAGCFIPIWSGALFGPEISGQRFIDGAYSNNSPKFEIDDAGQQHLNGARCLEINPFASDVEVSPKGETYLFKSRVLGSIYLANWRNIVRTCHAMLPFKPESYAPYLHGGHSDMKDFLMRNNLIKCRRCHEMSDVKGLDDDRNENKCDDADIKPQRACIFCLKLLEQVDSLRVSDGLIKAFHE